jgi:tetratricopeptide (TPR) repeat protein
MDAQGGSASAVQVEASGRRESKVVAAARVRSLDYEPIIEDTLANFARHTPDRRRRIYAHARSVVAHRLWLMRLPEPIVELEKLALDLAIGKIERRWGPRETAEKSAAKRSAAKKSAAQKAIPFNMREPRIELPAIPTMSMGARLLRRPAGPIGVAMALPVIAAMIFFGAQIGGKVTYRSAVGDLVERWFLHPGGEAGVTARVAAGDASAHRGPSRAAPIHAALAAESDTTTMAAACGSSMYERSPCTRAASGGGRAAETPKTETGTSWLDRFTASGDLTSGRAPSRTLNLPAVAAEDFVVGSATPYGGSTPDKAIMSPAGGASRAAAPQVHWSPLTRPINPKVAALIASGQQAALKGDLDRALREFNGAIRIDPKYPDSYLERGQTVFKLGEIERAIADYSAALMHDPQHGAALRARGMAHLYAGKTDLALADLSKAIEIGEHDPPMLAPIELFYARRSRGAIYDSKQQYDLEVADCTALIESYAHDPMLVDALAANYGSAGAANILARIYRQRASAFAKRSSVERAVADLTQAIPLSSDRGYAALIDRSKLHEGLGRHDLAAADARAALNIRPGSEEARLALSRLSALSNPAPPKGL